MIVRLCFCGASTEQHEASIHSREVCENPPEQAAETERALGDYEQLHCPIPREALEYTMP